MHRTFSNRTSASITTALACFAGLASLTCAACAHGRTLRLATNERGINVVGVGKASAPPDIARTSIGVEVRTADVQQATADATARMNAVTQAIKQLGIPDKDLRTHSFSIGFEQEQTPPPTPLPAVTTSRAAGAAATAAPAEQPPTPRGYYRVSNMLEVTIRDLSAVGRVLQAATSAGANNVWGIEFAIENTDALKVQARAQAVARAQQAATELATLAGVKLGKVLSLSEGEAEGRDGGPMLMSMRAANADVPIERGEISVSYGVRVSYDVDERDDHGDHDDHDDKKP